MNKKDQIKLEAISHIDEKIIDRVTQKRILLWNMHKRRKVVKRRLTIGLSVACFLLIASTLLLLMLPLGKQVPIYQGMTVSSNYNGVTVSQAESSNSIALRNSGHVNRMFPVLSMQSPSWSTAVHVLDNKHKSDHPQKNTSDTPVFSSQEQYYAKPNEDIYITVHIHNPDKFEILSFTLNGMKYSSYMFQEGSDMERLVLKVNVGLTEGLTEYTIDAIKYVDGTVLKDVRMEGEKTIRVIVSAQEMLSIESLKSSTDRVEFSFLWNESVVNQQIRSIALYRNGEKIRDISPTATAISDLWSNTEYTLIVTYWKNGEEHTIQRSFTTVAQIYPTVTLSNLKIQSNRVTFDIDYVDPAGIGEIAKIELLDEQGEKLAQGDKNTREFDAGVLSVGEYRVRVTYEYDAKDGKGMQSQAVEQTSFAFRMPLTGDIIKEHSALNPGIEIQASHSNAGVYAAAEGTVLEMRMTLESGLTATIQYNKNIRMIYKYLNSSVVATGETIGEGKLLGDLSGGVLHFEIIMDGVSVDPAGYLFEKT